MVKYLRNSLEAFMKALLILNSQLLTFSLYLHWKHVIFGFLPFQLNAYLQFINHCQLFHSLITPHISSYHMKLFLIHFESPQWILKESPIWIIIIIRTWISGRKNMRSSISIDLLIWNILAAWCSRLPGWTDETEMDIIMNLLKCTCCLLRT